MQGNHDCIKALYLTSCTTKSKGLCWLCCSLRSVCGAGMGSRWRSSSTVEVPKANSTVGEAP